MHGVYKKEGETRRERFGFRFSGQRGEEKEDNIDI